MIPVIVKLCESPSKAGGLLMINYTVEFKQDVAKLVNEKDYTHKQAADNPGISLRACFKSLFSQAALASDWSWQYKRRLRWIALAPRNLCPVCGSDRAMEGAFHHPSTGQQPKTFGCVRAQYDIQNKAETFGDPVQQLPAISPTYPYKA